ncbi:MAG: FMN-binding glutamate synthase family protein [Rhodobiaceae bacterium]|nr:FMN-binding glutamate synthase family protein [Rhodobiaceae bacterium]
MLDMLPPHVVQFLSLASSVFIFMIGFAVLFVAAVFIHDTTQKRDTILRNYPVVGHLRGTLTHLGEFFRQYFFALDREEMPFNRAERNWVHKSSKGRDNTVAFGSTRSLSPVGTPIFVNAPFPPLDEEAEEPPAVLFGPYARRPYEARSLINISGMSFGAISKPAVLALSQGARLAGCWMNTGEGGLSPHHLAGGADIVFQIGTAKYGVRNLDGALCDDRLREIASHDQVRMVEIKLSQGAKPGKGGILPGGKVTAEIAAIRGLPEGEDSISPNRHRDINSLEDLADMVAHVRDATGLPTGFKTVIGDTGWLDDLFAIVNSRGEASAPDFITVDSGDGGTGAAPMPLMDNMGLPIKEALPMVVAALKRAGLRDRVRVIASGKLITPAEIAWAYCCGADVVCSARGFMFALGCIQALKCNRNTCPTGITTHNQRLQRGLDPASKAVRVKNYIEKVHKGVGIIAHSCGVPHARALRPSHVRMVQANGTSMTLEQIARAAEAGRPERLAQVPKSATANT